MKLTKEAIDKLLEVKAHILEEPKRLVMDSYVRRKTFSDEFIGDFNHTTLSRPTRNFASCGTAACIAGWIVLLTDGMEVKNTHLFGADFWPERAAEILGISSDEEFLFHTDDWEELDVDLMNAYQNTDDLTVKAETAGKIIDKFIERYR